MAMWCVFVFVLSLLSGCLTTDLPYVEKYFDQTLDHFNSKAYGNRTYRQRYLIQDKYWKAGQGPIFFYTGNEGAITDFWAASGFVMEQAPLFNALIVFAEHRYYGKSLPFGEKSFEGYNVGLLTMDQALADFAILLTELKTQLSAPNVPVIAFGGSYGGMLSAYMRFKYPNVISGALAASAPIYMLDPSSDTHFFFSHVTKDFKDVSTECYNQVRSAFSAMNNLARQGKTGLSKLSQTFRLCAPLTDAQAAYTHLLKWVRNAFTYLAMLDYPYPVSFLGMQMPANPVKVACSVLLSASDPIQGLADAAGIYYTKDQTHNPPCYNITADFVDCADPTGCGLGLDSKAWDYQACTEIPLPSGSNNQTDMFPVLPFTPEMRRDYCLKQWGVVPRDRWSLVQFWGTHIKSASNILFSNGNLDPWMGGGVLKSLSKSLIAVPVIGGAHHLDLRASNKLDPPGVVKARTMEQTAIRDWITQAMKR